MSSKILQSKVFAKNLLNLPLDYLESITALFYNQALYFFTIPYPKNIVFIVIG